MEEISKVQICQTLKEMYDESENKIKTDALVNRAFIDKTSSETINDKVNAQMNSIKAEVFKINPRFKEGSKNYDQTKTIILEALANYEKALIELGEFYDGKIEQLILRKVELEAILAGSIINEEYLKEKYERKVFQKNNDGVKKSVKENIKNAISKIVNKKKEIKEEKVQTPVNVRDISRLVDQQDVFEEIEDSLEYRVQKTIDDEKNNNSALENVEKEISLINQEINRLNEQKKKTILDAMEVGEKAIAVNIKKPKMFKNITRFFASRFNTAKVVKTSVIDPFNLRINDFRENDLARIKG